MAFMPFQSPGGMQPGITQRFGWPGLSPHPQFAPIGPAFPPNAPPPVGPVPSMPPTTMAGALAPGGMANALVRGNDSGRGDWSGQRLGSSVAQQMMGGGLRHVGGAGSGPGYFAGSGNPAAQPSSMSQALTGANPGYGNLYAGETMRAPPKLEPGADYRTGAGGFATAQGDWRHSLGGSALSMLSPVPAFGLSQILGEALKHSPDFTVGRPQSNIRAMPGLPFGGLQNIATGAVWKPTPVAQLAPARPAAKPAYTVTNSSVAGGKRGGGNSGAGFGATHGAGGFGGKGGGTGGGWAGGGSKGGTGRGPK